MFAAHESFKVWRNQILVPVFADLKKRTTSMSLTSKVSLVPGDLMWPCDPKIWRSPTAFERVTEKCPVLWIVLVKINYLTICLKPSGNQQFNQWSTWRLRTGLHTRPWPTIINNVWLPKPTIELHRSWSVKKKTPCQNFKFHSQNVTNQRNWGAKSTRFSTVASGQPSASTGQPCWGWKTS